jgi:hypothetical protein
VPPSSSFYQLIFLITIGSFVILFGLFVYNVFSGKLTKHEDDEPPPPVRGSPWTNLLRSWISIVASATAGFVLFHEFIFMVNRGWNPTSALFVALARAALFSALAGGGFGFALALALIPLAERAPGAHGLPMRSRFFAFGLGVLLAVAPWVYAAVF